MNGHNAYFLIVRNSFQEKSTSQKMIWGMIMWGEIIFFYVIPFVSGFPHSSVGRESACNAGNLGSIPGLGRSPGEGNGNPLQYSCLEKLMDRGAWWAIVHGVARVKR